MYVDLLLYYDHCKYVKNNTGRWCHFLFTVPSKDMSFYLKEPFKIYLNWEVLYEERQDRFILFKFEVGTADLKYGFSCITLNILQNK